MASHGRGDVEATLRRLAWPYKIRTLVRRLMASRSTRFSLYLMEVRTVLLAQVSYALVIRFRLRVRIRIRVSAGVETAEARTVLLCSFEE